MSTFIYIYIKFRFTCSESDLLKYCKVPKYHDQDFLKIFLLLSTLPKMVQVPIFNSKKLILPENKLSIGKVESFLK